MRQYVTEDEAKTKWCPMVRHTQTPVERRHTGEVFGINRYGRNSSPLFSKCIASACMFWCWQDDYGASMGVVASKTHGYCGATR